MNENRNIDSIFCAAIEIESSIERQSWLNQACGEDAELRGQVDRLLQAHFRGGSIVDSPAHALDVTVNQPPSERPGSQIGRYKLLQQIGEGGMGTVYMAEQTQPVQRKVALKLIKPGMDSGQIIARFEAERQALAMMDHINIARVLDAGTTEHGRPYFVMELIHGVPITKYCDDSRLTPRQRLELFVPVCQAIQHAHQKGIIHRDIKPSNVMVTLYDGKPVPKVIDFGVAKANDQKLTGRTLFTQYGTMVGTLEYMSPEQAEMSALGIDTRSDIYSLGVLLYELLTGSTPLDRAQMKAAAFAEVLRLIKEDEPPRPSTRLSESGKALASISALRQTEPAKLSKLMRGELDWIVMKTLEKDRNRRYESASGFAADVQRYLNNEPVQACPPSAMYRFRKFASRNRTGLLTASLLGIGLLVSTSAIGWSIRDRSAQRTEMERERTAARQQIENERLVQKAKLEERIDQALGDIQLGYERDNLPEALTALKSAEALLATDASLSLELRQRIELWRAELTILERLDELAFRNSLDEVRETDAAYSRVFLDIGINVDEMPVEDAGKQIRAYATWRRLTEALDRWTGVRHDLAHLQRRTSVDAVVGADVFKRAKLRKQRLLQVARAADGDELRSQARLAVEKGDFNAGLQLSESPEVNQLPASTLRQLSMLIYWGDGGSHRNSAVQMLVNAQRQRPGDFQLNHACANYYGQMAPPQWAEAAHYLSIANALRPDHVRVQNFLAIAYLAQGKVDEALASSCRAIALSPKYAKAWEMRGLTYEKLAQPENALADFSKAIELDPKNALAWIFRGQTYKKLAQPENAIADFSKGIELDPKNLVARRILASFYSQQGRHEDAVDTYNKIIQDFPNDAQAYNGFAWLLATSSDAKQRAPARAVELAQKAVELSPKDVGIWNTLGIAHCRNDEWKAGVEALTKSMDLSQGGGAFDWFFLAMSHWNLDNKEEARKWFEQAVAWMEKNEPQNEQLLRFRAEAAALLGVNDK
jgi:eukaryotic-like serine/threonine-protein kinase